MKHRRLFILVIWCNDRQCGIKLFVPIHHLIKENMFIFRRLDCQPLTNTFIFKFKVLFV